MDERTLLGCPECGDQLGVMELLTRAHRARVWAEGDGTLQWRIKSDSAEDINSVKGGGFCFSCELPVDFDDAIAIEEEEV